MLTTHRLLIPLAVLLLAACSRPSESEAPAPVASEPPALAAEAQLEATAQSAPAMDLDIDASLRAAYAEFWNRLLEHCDRAYAGRVEDAEPQDLPWHGEAIVLHVFGCSPIRIDMALGVGSDRSQTWQISRTPNGLDFHHDLRLPDGSATPLSGWGGAALPDGNSGTMRFSLDEASRALLEGHGRGDLLEAEWSLQIEPGESIRYALAADGQRYQIAFSFDAALPQPPAPWSQQPIE